MKMDRDDYHAPNVATAAPNGAAVLRPALTLAEWNMVLGSVAKGSIETHLDLFVKLKGALESELKTGFMQ